MTIRTDIHRPQGASGLDGDVRRPAMRVLIAAGKTVFWMLFATMMGLLLWKFIVMVIFLWDLMFDWFKLLGI
jgi:hypothetical protein